MSMKKDYIIHDLHTRSITACGYSAAKREVYFGFEDGTIKSIEVDKGLPGQTYTHHRGLITAFLYWPKNKSIICSSNDWIVSVIGSAGLVIDRILVGKPVYSMAFNEKREEIIFGVDGGLQFHKITDTKENFSHFIDTYPLYTVNDHSDIVKCLVVIDSRIYSAGYDGALCIYEANFANDKKIVPIFRKRGAHNAGISCMSIEKDPIENSTWILTGSFDKTLKVWSGDGKLIHKFDCFISSVTGLCYLPKLKAVCCVAGTNTAYVYDPKSGEEVTDYIDTFSDDTSENHYLQLLSFFKELDVMVATTSRKQVIVFKYNQTGAITSLKYRNSLDSICYTKKTPILIFVGDSQGSVIKWEQRQSNQLIYSSEFLIKTDSAPRESSKLLGQLKQQAQQVPDPNRVIKTKQCTMFRVDEEKSAADRLEEEAEKEKNDPKLFNTASTSSMLDSKAQFFQFRKNNVVFRLVFIESMDLLLAACEDGCIYVWGFDGDAVEILKKMKYNEDQSFGNSASSSASKNNFMNDDYTATTNTFNNNNNNNNNDNSTSISNDYDYENETPAQRLRRENEETVTNRVAGFSLKIILSEHTSSVTSLVVIEKPADQGGGTFLLSGGWDRRICIWDLCKLRLYDIFRNKNHSNNANNLDEVELASDGNILDMCYCEEYNYFAYASTDSMCYIRKFDIHGENMTLVTTLQGHRNEINCVRWNSFSKTWITGGEDSTLRVWSANFESLHVINCSAPVNAIALNMNDNIVIAACHDTLKIFDMEEYNLLQTSIGHRDSIRDVIFIPERNHIITVSWDKTVKIWRFAKKSKSYHKKVEKEAKFETRVMDEMKKAMKREASFHMEDYADRLLLNHLSTLSINDQ